MTQAFTVSWTGLKWWKQTDCGTESRKDIKQKDLKQKSKDIILSTKVHIVKSYGLSSSHVRICELTIKKTECQRTDASKLWCWRRLWKVPWTGRRSHLSILKEVNRKYSLEGLMLNLKFQYFGHQIQRANSLAKTWCWERLKAKGEEGRREWDGRMASQTQGTWTWTTPGVSERQGGLECRSSWGHKELDMI